MQYQILTGHLLRSGWHGEIRYARSKYWCVLLDARGGRGSERRSKTRDGNAADWRAHRCRDQGLVNPVVPISRLDAEIWRFTDIILSRSSATIRFGKQAFSHQIDHPLAVAYDIASEVMVCNLLLADAAEGIDAFLQKRPARWRDK